MQSNLGVELPRQLVESVRAKCPYRRCKTVPSTQKKKSQYYSNMNYQWPNYNLQANRR